MQGETGRPNAQIILRERKQKEAAHLLHVSVAMLLSTGFGNRHARQVPVDFRIQKSPKAKTLNKQ
ncbi:MAG: hypothetical protein CMO07_16185 [Thalassospira sp.]|nr:hypothetical protein [Thalassospira sp.]